MTRQPRQLFDFGVRFAAGTVALAIVAAAVSCSSSNNGGGKAAVTVAPPIATSAAAVSTKSPTVGSAGTVAVGAAVAQSFAPPGGSAGWVNVADGCHGVKAPANADARNASDPGVTVDEIKLGTTQALTGPASVYAPIVEVMQDCFDLVNREGGIYGRKLNLIVKDDQYTPANTQPLTQQLVEQEKIFADLSPLGTSENTQIYDYLNAQKVPQLFVATGASKWGADPSGHPYTVGYPPDYQTIGQNFAKYIQSNLKGKKVGILYQNDDFGKDYVTGLALKSAADLGWKPAVVMYDGAVDTSLADIAGGKQNIEGVISAGWYHQPTETNDAGIQTVADFLKKNDANLELNNWPVYGYILGQLYVESFKRAGVNPTRASLMQAVESFNGYTVAQLLPGVTVSTGKTDHRPIKCVQLSKAHDGAFINFGDVFCADK